MPAYRHTYLLYFIPHEDTHPHVRPGPVLAGLVKPKPKAGGLSLGIVAKAPAQPPAAPVGISLLGGYGDSSSGDSD